MCWEIASWARRQHCGGLAGKALLMILASYADRDGLCFPSQAQLAEDCGTSIDTIQRRLKVLAAAGLIEREGRWGPQGRFVDLIVLRFREGPIPQHGAAYSRRAKAAGRTDPKPHTERSMNLHSESPENRKTHAPGARARSLDPDFKPDLVEAQRLGLTGDEAAAAADRFLDHHRAKGTASPDWAAAWRNWIRVAVDRRQVAEQRNKRAETRGGTNKKPRRNLALKALEYERELARERGLYDANASTNEWRGPTVDLTETGRA